MVATGLLTPLSGTGFDGDHDERISYSKSMVVEGNGVKGCRIGAKGVRHMVFEVPESNRSQRAQTCLSGSKLRNQLRGDGCSG